MDYNVDLNYNNSTVYNVIDDLAQWNEYFEAAMMYAKNNKAPYDISKGALPDLAEKGTNVKCTIMLDIEVLDTISKIISMMVTCNQCLLQAPQLNNY